MRFSLEALQAHHGDALLVHWGTAAAPRLMVIDGGPDPTYRDTMRDRLVQIAGERPGGTLDVDLLMVSHIDDDHIAGVQRLLRDLDRGKLPQVRVDRFWFNGFDDLVGSGSGFVSASAGGAATSAKTLAAVRRRVGTEAGAVIASVPQGRTVASLAATLGLGGNPPFDELITGPRPRANAVQIGTQLKLTVLGPSQERIDALRDEWTRVSAAATASPSALAYVDDSVPNLSSIVVLAKAAGRTMLLTGDARGDDILAALRTARLFDASGRLQVDLLKVPHHGSDRNVETEFFRAVRADHYVISGDGSHHNPELATLAMLTEARRGDRYTVHFTNREARIEQWLRHNRTRADRFDVRFRRADRPSVRVDLADQL